MEKDALRRFGFDRRAAGFTLVELMVVTAIASVLIALSTIQMVTMRRKSTVNDETRNLVSRIRDARVQAVALGRKHGVYIGGANDPLYPSQAVVFRKTNPDATSNLIEAPDGGADSVLVQQVLGEVGGRATVQVTNVPSSGSVTVIFDSSGSPTVSITNSGTVTTYDWSGGAYNFQLGNVDATLALRQVTLRSDGTLKVSQ